MAPAELPDGLSVLLLATDERVPNLALAAASAAPVAGSYPLSDNDRGGRPMVATHSRRAGWVGAAGAAGALLLGAPASPGTAQATPAEPPHGQLLQAPDGGLYLLVAGQAHPITPAPLTAEAFEALAAAGPGEALPDGAFWLVPAAAPPVLAPVAPPAPPAPPRPVQAATARPSVAPFFATQTAVAPRGAQVTPAASSATRRPNGWPAGQS